MSDLNEPAYTPREEYQCDGSTTHYQGCQCHEARHAAEIEKLHLDKWNALMDRDWPLIKERNKFEADLLQSQALASSQAAEIERLKALVSDLSINNDGMHAQNVILRSDLSTMEAACDLQIKENSQLRSELEACRSKLSTQLDAWAEVTSRLMESRDQVERLSRALSIAANQLEGVSLAIKAHGQNIDVPFFIETYDEMAKTAREALSPDGRPSEVTDGS